MGLHEAGWGGIPRIQRMTKAEMLFGDLVARSMALELAVQKRLLTRDQVTELCAEADVFVASHGGDLPRAWDAFRQTLVE